MTVRVVMKGGQLGPKWRRATDRSLSAIARASTGGARDAAASIKRLGDQDIRNAGKFGRRWQDSLTADVEPRSGYLINARIDVAHKIPFAGIFETGGTIRGKPMLWIPLSFTGIKIRAREWAQRFGGLFSVRRTGKAPLLLSIRDREPKFFGVTSVTLKKRFHLRQICNRVMRGFAKFYNSHLRLG